MSKLEKIIADLKLAESKKEALQQAFETLKSNASSVASFTLQWSDLDAHFSSLHSSIRNRLETLQSQLQQIESNPSTLINLFSHKQPNSIRSQVSDALRSSPSPATLVLDAILLLLKNGEGDFEESVVRHCVLLLEQLVQLVSIPPKVDGEVREKARRLAVEWKEKMRMESMGEVMGFLEILGIYGLVGEFDRDDLLELFEVVAVRDRAPELCRVLELEEKMPEFIQKLITKGRQIQAMKFIYEFELVKLFPPVHLIKAHLRLTKKAVKKIRKKGKLSLEAQKEAASKELAALRAVAKCISKYKLEAQFQLEPLRRNIGELKRLKRENEAIAAATDPTPSPAPSSPATGPASASKAQPQQQTGKKRSAVALEAQSNQQSGNKRRQTAVLAGAAPKGHFGSARTNPHMSLSAGHYGLTNFNPVNQYMIPPAQQYGSSFGASWSTGQFGLTTTHPGAVANLGTRQFNLAGTPAGMAANANPNWSVPHYSGNVPLPLGYRPVTYVGGYGLPPQQHPP
ncbi:FRIGIDA-like protein 2 isoform X2 [Vitis vinifera]|uniref:FRIGIDA-like protein 2 isoform X2 n=1 Tax=Vitis vinifera TaxID=29760 RepID=UPI000540344E|nr:FRIGIDA-like protein 2 isoform X2 [Vitis vinifera]|eukprot:XP_010659992.1 PREDICTED: FRIGIDA-like protein 2 isoform X2 [Vitis vinifera]